MMALDTCNISVLHDIEGTSKLFVTLTIDKFIPKKQFELFKENTQID
jgi:hypothetical protein